MMVIHHLSSYSSNIHELFKVLFFMRDYQRRIYR